MKATVILQFKKDVLSSAKVKKNPFLNQANNRKKSSCRGLRSGATTVLTRRTREILEEGRAFLSEGTGTEKISVRSDKRIT